MPKPATGHSSYPLSSIFCLHILFPWLRASCGTPVSVEMFFVLRASMEVFVVGELST
jgi:hypothetical protein